MRTRLLFLFSILTVHNLHPFAEEIAMKAEKAVVITFPSQPNRIYNVLGAETAEGPWRSLQDGIAGTGGEVTVFYKSESDQKLFFKVEGAEGSPGEPLLLTPTQQSLLAAARLDLTGQNLPGTQLPGANLTLFKLNGANFENANFRGANFSQTSSRGANFAGADLRGILTDGGSVFESADLRGANFEGTRLWARMNGADFRDAKMDGATFILSSLNGANFSGQNFSNVTIQLSDLIFADLSGANLAGGNLSRNGFQDTILTGANLVNANLEGNSFIRVPFTDRDLRGSVLRGVFLQSDWSRINAAGVDASLLYAKNGRLAGANFSDANLEAAVFAGANLEGANLRNAKLQGADLTGANLKNADFTGADLSFADVRGANLAGAVGFDADQPGMNFGQGLLLPDGGTRTGVNPGTALARAPSRLRFEINDYGRVATREFTISNGRITESGRPEGILTYSESGMIAFLGWYYPTGGSDDYTLLFTSPGSGKLFKNQRNGTVGVFQIGTFTVLE